MESFELVLTEFARDDDGWKQSESHPGANALLDSFDAGELGDVAGANVLHCEHLVEFGAVAATGFGEEQLLAGEVGWFYGASLGERMGGGSARRKMRSV